MENNLAATARIRNLRGSARKARLVLDLIRGKSIYEAQNILHFSKKRMAKNVEKLLNSAIANATQAAGKADMDKMIVEKAWADDGQIMKRTMPRAQGRATIIRRRTCHITIGITEKE